MGTSFSFRLSLRIVGRSEVPTQRDRPTQSVSMHVSLSRALRRVELLIDRGASWDAFSLWVGLSLRVGT
jgi:hypothetical protein